MVKRGRIVAFFLVLLLIASVMGVTTKDIVKDIKLGLDLQGGFEVLYEVLPAKKGDVIDKDALVSTVNALNKRVNVLGVSEPNIQIEGKDRIRVQLAGVTDQEKVREILSTQAKLTFRDVDDNIVLDGSRLAQGGANQSFDEAGRPSVSLTVKDSDDLKNATQTVLNKGAGRNLMVIWLDFEEGKDSYKAEAAKAQAGENPKYLSAATVDQVFNRKSVSITGGNFTVESANELASLLNAGSLPVDLKETYSTSVGAKFGEQALQKTIFAGFVGIGIIFLFMLVFYRFPGMIAVVTLSTFIYLTLLIFDWMNAVLTLPGIAALILGVGMAVDANIITYERIKEELKSGKSILSAYKSGNKNSFWTIFDANITTLLAAGVLFVFGTSSVRGFAVMLIVSILLSFLTAVYGSRLLLGLWVNSRFLNKKPGYFGVKESEIRNLADADEEGYIPTKFDKFDFVKHHKKFFIASSIMIIIGIGVLATFRLNLGIDFASGTRVEILANEALTKEEMTDEFKKLNLKPDEVVISGNESEIGVARFIGEFNQDQIHKVKNHFKDLYGSDPNVSTVSPTVGKELARNALYASLIASIGIIIYVAIRFEWIMGVAAVVALIHDAFFIIALFSVTRLEVDLTFIAAILTIIGYSINDTIVTFDRMRELYKKKKKIKTYEDLAKIVNMALRQTLTRSINTVLTVIITVVALLIFGSESIFNFSFGLLVGLIAGMYSSIFIAAQLWLVWKHKQLTRKREAKSQPEPQI
ncbi:protein translocase subunit SecDF [Fredinandcohnia quinoae]|uniref:Multifunctional fusion protein n=1 Tax=Fredinandcohnia quinoae TaxID=2918902 RepID=A0AAW5E2E7_9BACI|nr:protein translocase subunit SecDF [Fredinandcohnia sp. SECRCQ15]MCH1626533.1 protein translocase subunit SecDF [Fredinandcohnia sp. SECRCQ15]